MMASSQNWSYWRLGIGQTVVHGSVHTITLNQKNYSYLELMRGGHTTESSWGWVNVKRTSVMKKYPPSKHLLGGALFQQHVGKEA